ncbi:copper homeostasis membrane protein CopD [soil metagenome]
MDLAVIGLRWVQMMGAMILFGSSLFFVYALPKTIAGLGGALHWRMPLLRWAAAIVMATSVLGFLAQTVVLAGSVQDGLQIDALTAAAGMNLGLSTAARTGAGGLCLLVLSMMKPGRLAWWVCVTAGGIICASFAWMGHGAASPGELGVLHTSSDVIHTLAAGAWIGALVGFLILLLTDRDRSVVGRNNLHAALSRFAGIGSGLVAVLIATGLVNSWFLVGLSGLPTLLATPYGQLLTIKLVLFIAMLGLAAANRFTLTPSLGRVLAEGSEVAPAVTSLRRSLLLETALSIGVIAVVALLGTLAPPMSL